MCLKIWVCLWNVLYLDSRLDEEFRDEDVRMPQEILSCLKSLLHETKPDRFELQSIWLFDVLDAVEAELADGVLDYPCMNWDIHRMFKIIAQRQDVEQEQIRRLRMALLPYADTGNAEDLRETARLFSRDAELFVGAVLHASQRKRGGWQSAQFNLSKVLVVSPGEDLNGSGVDAEALSAWVARATG